MYSNIYFTLRSCIVIGAPYYSIYSRTDVEARDKGHGNADSHMPQKPLLDSDTPEMKRFAKGLALSVAYGANIGGIATLTGTPPNLVLKNHADDQ